MQVLIYGTCEDWLGPSAGAAGGADGGSDVAFIAVDLVGGGVSFDFGEGFAISA